MQKPKSINKKILYAVKHRLKLGQKKYRNDTTDLDPRDWLGEATEEALDHIVYLTAQHFRMLESREFYFAKMYQVEKLMKEIANDEKSKYRKKAEIWINTFNTTK
mgnify:FL=1